MICLSFTACNSDSEINLQDSLKTEEKEPARNEESKNLEKLYAEIIAFSGNSKPCTDNKNWAYTTIGVNSCGQPSQYIIYSKTIDVPQFLAKVNAYTEKQIEFNKKWYPANETLTCAPLAIPILVDCVDGKATLIL